MILTSTLLKLYREKKLYKSLRYTLSTFHYYNLPKNKREVCALTISGSDNFKVRGEPCEEKDPQPITFRGTIGEQWT